MAAKRKLKIVSQPLRIDFGCGPNKKDGFVGADAIAFKGVDHVFDIGAERFPWDDSSVEDAHASHFVEHLDAAERIRFVNELYRVLRVGGQATIITPHWASSRAFGSARRRCLTRRSVP